MRRSSGAEDGSKGSGLVRPLSSDLVNREMFVFKPVRFLCNLKDLGNLCMG